MFSALSFGSPLPTRKEIADGIICVECRFGPVRSPAMCSRTPNESHRSIYGKWPQALDHFDPSPRCPRSAPRAISTGIGSCDIYMSVRRSTASRSDSRVFRIRTEIGERGATVKASYDLPSAKRAEPRGQSNAQSGQRYSALPWKVACSDRIYVVRRSRSFELQTFRLGGDRLS